MNNDKLYSGIICILRIAVGWHFLYEGLVKLLIPGWSSSGYLLNANWLFAKSFQTLANNPDVLKFVDFMNIWGLIFIGAGLLLGIGIRYVSVAGIILLTLYYVVSPSLIGIKYNSVSSEGSYLIINKNIIEALVLLLMVILPNNKQIGIQDLIKLISRNLFIAKKRNLEEIPIKKSSPEMRRTLLHSFFILPFAVAFGIAFSKKREQFNVDSFTGATTNIEPKKLVSSQTQTDLFFGKIADNRISRLILGGSCFSGWQHPRNLKYVNELATAYNSKKRIWDTLRIAEKLGINTVNVFLSQMPLIQSYNKNFDGNLKSIVAVAVNGDDWTSEIKQAIEFEATMIYVQPYVSDRLVYYGDIDVLRKTVSFIRERGIAAGIACFSPRVIESCEAIGLKPDFYVKAIHPDNYSSANPTDKRKDFDPAFNLFYQEQERLRDNIFDLFPGQTLEIMSKTEVPWIGFKTLASGAFSSSEGFKYAFQGGADFISVGMFDFQLEKNVKTVLEILES